MKGVLKLSLVAGLLMFSASCQSTQLAGPTEMSVAEFGLYLDQTMPKLLSKNLPGVGVALVETGSTVYENGFGSSDLKSALPVSTDTQFQVASISKTVTAWGVLKLAEMKKIDLDAPIGNYIHRWKLPRSSHDAQKVTIRSVLAHRGGLSLGGYPGYAPGERIPTLEESLSGDNGVMYGFFRMGPVYQQNESWAKFSYSGGGYTLLQLLIEEVSGQAFSDFMMTEILRPLGMTHSSFEYVESMVVSVSKAHSVSGSELPNYLFVEKAAAGLYTTAGDLAKLLNELYLVHSDKTYNTKVLSNEYVSLFYAANPFVRDGYDVMGYFRVKENGTITTLFHGGSNQGWKAYYAVDLVTGRGFVLLTNSDAGSEVISQVGKLFTKSVLRNSFTVSMGL